MEQVVCRYEPSPQVEGGVQLAIDVPMNKSMIVEEEKSVKAEDNLAEASTTVDSLKDSAKSKGVDVEGEGGEQKDNAVVDLVDDKTHVVSMTDKDKSEAARDKGTSIDIEKLENGNVHEKVAGEKGVSYEEECDKYGDNKDIDGENDLLLALGKKDWEQGDDQTLSKTSNNSFMFHYTCGDDESGTVEEQATFFKELEQFYSEKLMEFKHPKFYGEELNWLKLWRQVTGLGGYDQVTLCKLWRQVGESFKPPNTCTTVSWTFRNFYEKVLLEYEKHMVETGKIKVVASTLTERIASVSQVCGRHMPGSGRARRESATRAMQVGHSKRPLGNGNIVDPITKDKGATSVFKKDKTPKSSGSANWKRTPTLEDITVRPYKSDKQHDNSTVIDIGPPADWVKINILASKDCYEVYALVPGLLREEIHVQSDPAGRLIVTGEPGQLVNPWGITPFKKVITFPSRIDPHQTSSMFTPHGQLFVHVPFEQLES